MPSILIVEDSKQLSSTLASLLEILGHTVAAANSYSGALAAIGRQQPQVVVLDYHLASQGQEGLGLLEAIRSRPELADTRVIMMSGMAASETCRAKGADGFVQKPFTLDDLLSEMARLGVETEV